MAEKMFHSDSMESTIALARSIGAQLRGGEVFEFLSDLGGGKTTFVSGLAQGFGSVDPVASPSFTLNYVYRCKDEKLLSHFDFYRLDDAGIVGNELAEVLGDPDVVVAVEWGDIVHNVLPDDRIKITIAADTSGDTHRVITCHFPDVYSYVFAATPKDQSEDEL